MTESASGGTQILPAGNVPHGLKPGSLLGPYEIVAPIGQGGMGQVFRARDARLGRNVAVKVLSPTLAGDTESLRRFEREARAVAALSHPNVLVIHDVGTVAGAPYLVTELLEGESLRQILARGQLPLARVFDLARQILAGLAAAHDKGIVHRDLKPANLFVTQDGALKILDFGLATSLRPDLGAESTQTPTLTDLTGPGRFLGTVGYMAPEQARGEPTGSRADLFAFGCVLYEMVTGRRAFPGEAAMEILAKILTEEPAPVTVANPAASSELGRVIERCLAKSPEDRFQTAREVAAALQVAGDSDAAAIVAVGGAERSRRGRRLAALVAAALVAGLALVALFRRGSPPSAVAAPGTWEQITFFADSAVSPALSRDGRMLTFLRGPSTFNGPAEVYVKVLPDGEALPLTRDGQRKMGPVFSPDGSKIAYTQRDAAGAWDTWLVPVLASEPRRWLPNASGLTWISPGRILFSEVKTGIHMGLVTALESRAEAREIYFPSDPRGMAHRSSLSPDGEWVLAAEMETGEWLPCRLLPFDGSSAGRRVGPDGQCTHAEWSPDGEWMYFSSNAGGRFQLWRQRFPDGDPTPLTAGPLEIEGLALTPDGRSVLASVGERQSSVVVVDGDRELPIGGEGFVFLDGNSHFGFPRPFSPDGARLFYQQRREASRSTPGSGELSGELWSADLATGLREPVLPGVEVSGYDLAPDGAQLVAGAIGEDGGPEVWLVALDRRSAPRRLELGRAYSPWFGPTGEIFFRRSHADAGDLVFVWRPETGETLQVLDTPVQELVAVSPDGAWLVAVLPVTEGRAFGQLVALPRDGGDARPICANCYLGWAPGGRYAFVFLYGADHRGMEDVRTVLVALPDGESLPLFPQGGVERHQELLSLPGVVWTKDGRVYPGPRPDLYAYAGERAQRNVFRIPLPDG